jgi:hypothetical protein
MEVSLLPPYEVGTILTLQDIAFSLKNPHIYGLTQAQQPLGREPRSRSFVVVASKPDESAISRAW